MKQKIKKFGRHGKHRSIETEHPDGRRDVTIQAGTLDVDDSDPKVRAAKEKIEKEVLPQIANRPVTVVVIHKPTNTSVAVRTKASRVRHVAERVVKKHGYPKKEYILAEVDRKTGDGKTTTLV